MVVFGSFVKYKAHIGYSIKNTILLTTWFLYKLRKFIWIINIFKTILFLKIVLRFLRFIIKHILSVLSLFAGIGKLNKKFFTFVSTIAIIGKFICLLL